MTNQRDSRQELMQTAATTPATELSLNAAPLPARRRSRLGRWLFVLLVLLPSLLGGAYFGYLASDRYVSQAGLTVRSMDGGGRSLLGDVLGGMVKGASDNDSYVVQEYVLSRQIVRQLQERLDLRQIWGIEEADWLVRLPPDATEEELYEYYRDRVSAIYDSTSGVLDLEVEAFGPQQAQMIALAIVDLADQLVDDVAERAREDALQFARQEVVRAEERLEGARLAVQRFREEHGELDPGASASAVGEIVAELEGDLARARTEMAALRSYMREDSAQVQALKARVNALEQQLQREKARLAADSSDGTYSDLLARFERLRLEEEFAREAYTMALTGLEQARADAQRRHLYLVPFVEPTLPDDAIRPDRPLMIATVVAASLLAYGIILLIIAAIREHSRL